MVDWMDGWVDGWMIGWMIRWVDGYTCMPELLSRLLNK